MYFTCLLWILSVCLGYGQVVSIKEGKKPKSSESVCASNKKIYSNLCEFYIDTCHKGNYARLVDMSACTGQKKLPLYATFNQKQPMICADDNKTYRKCESLKRDCKSEPFKQVHHGECGKCSKENVCWWVRQEIVRSLWRRNPSVRTLIKLIYLKKSQKIRASDGQTYDKCEFQVAKCKMFRDQGTILTRTYESVDLTKNEIRSDRINTPSRIKSS